MKEAGAPNGEAVVAVDASAFTLETLGDFCLRRDSGEIVLGPSKPLALITYLHLMPGRTAERDRLLDTLWGDVDEKRGKHALRQTVWQLRQDLRNDAAVAVINGTISLAAEIRSDADAFVQAVQAARLAEAVALYHGDFLGAFVVPGGLGFEHWADAERRHFKMLFLRAAESQAHALLGAGQFRHARELANRMREADRLDETAWRLLIEAAMASGDRVSALADAQGLEDVLSAEGRQPQPVTRSLLSRVRAEPAERDERDKGLVADLVGRERQFTALVAHFRRARRGHGEIVDVVAPAGMGKTRLLRDFARYLTADGKAVAYVRGLPADRDLSWSYVAELVRQLTKLQGAVGVAPTTAATLAAIDPTLPGRWSGVISDTAVGDEALRRRIAALGELVRAVSEDGPPCLLLDDLHWADDESRNVLHRMAGRLQEEGILVVAAHRAGANIKLADAARTLHLEPLDVVQTTAFVASLGQLRNAQWSADLCIRLHASTKGSPLLALETLKLAIDSESLVLSDGQWSCTSPVSLHRLLESGGALTRRIEKLSPSERRSLLLLAVAGGPLSTGLIAAARADDGVDVIAELSAIERAGLVMRLADEWSLTHDEIGASVHAMSKPEHQTVVHSALGRTLLSQRAHSSDLRVAARHLAAANDPLLARAAEQCVRGARSAADRRPARLLLAELLGAEPSNERVKGLTAGLPWSLRYKNVKTFVAAVVIGALLLMATILWSSATPNDAPSMSIAVWKSEPNGRWRISDRAVTRSDLVTRKISLGSLDRSEIFAADRPRGVIRPGARGTLVTTETFPDSGGEDVVLLLSGGRSPTRVTRQKGDDVAGDWSPDGRYIVIQTDRWSDRSMSDIAIITADTTGHVVKRLTNKPAGRDVLPLWSPDGTRIAFLRAAYDGSISGRGRALCVVSVDGVEESCNPVTSHSVDHLIGWASPVEIVGVFADSTGSARILAVNTESRVIREVAEAANTQFQTHVQGWIVCFCRRNAAEPFQSLLLPVDRPEDAVRLEPSDPPSDIGLFPSGHEKSYLERLTIEGAERPLPAEGEYQLRLRGWDGEGRPVQPLAVRWRSGDTTVASVSREGVVNPRRTGRATIWATAGGWRSDSAVMIIAPAETRSVLAESWKGDIESRWALFGEPLPNVVQTSRGGALAPNGDSSFTSGAYLRQALPTASGIGVEFEFSASITSRSWQYLNVKIVASNLASFAGWDHRTGDLPIGNYLWRSCGIYYPNEGHQDQLELIAGIRRVVPVAADASHGAWLPIRIQVFPDGRCGVAINGRPVAVLERAIPLGDSAFLVMDAYSHRTQVLFGPLSVWLGVRHDVDWSKQRAAH